MNYAAIERLNGMTSKFGALQAFATTSPFNSICPCNQRASVLLAAQKSEVLPRDPSENRVDPFDQILPHLSLRGPKLTSFYQRDYGQPCGRAAHYRIVRFSIPGNALYRVIPKSVYKAMTRQKPQIWRNEVRTDLPMAQVD